MNRGASALLQVSDLCVRFARGDVGAAVDSLSYELHRGESLGIVGESGSGKSVSSLALMGLLPAAASVSGRALFDGVDLLTQSEKQLRGLRGNRIAMVFQDAMSSLNPYLTVGEQIMEPLRLHLGQGRQQARQSAAELLAQCGIAAAEDRLRQYPHEFSGGMRQRAMIAMALAAEPDVLIADEPTSALDVTVQADILALLSELQRVRGFALIMISHDLDVVRRVTDGVLVMQRGRLVEQGATREVLDHPTADYTRRLLDAVPVGAKPEAVRYSDRGGGSLVKARGVSVTFPLGRTHARAVEDVDLHIQPGEVLGIVGESGSGKTSLLRALIRIQSIASGEIYLQESRIDGLTPRQLRPHRRRMQMVFQDPFASLNPRMTIHDIVAEPLQLHGLTSGAVETSARVADLLQEVGLTADSANRYPHEFSGGQRQRIAIARALAAEPELLLADEPVSALDVTVQANILSLLQQLVLDRKIGLLIVSHDLAVIRLIADRVMVMHQGRVLESGPTEQIFLEPSADYTKALLAARP